MKERIYTPEEYLELEEHAKTKSEYWNGRIYAMAGGTPEHGLIGVNVLHGFRNALAGRPYYVFNSDVKVSIRYPGPYVYPDASVVCGSPTYVGPKSELLANPDVLVEVLSSSTFEHDVIVKGEAYRGMPSVGAYVLVAQNRPWAQVQLRLPDGSWRFTETSDPNGIVAIESLDCALKMADIYKLVTFAEPAPIIVEDGPNDIL